MRSILFGTAASLALLSGAANAAPGGNGHGAEHHGPAAHAGKPRSPQPAKAKAERPQPRAAAVARQQRARETAVARQRQAARETAVARQRQVARETAVARQRQAARKTAVARQRQAARETAVAHQRQVARETAVARQRQAARETAVARQRQIANRAMVRQDVRRVAYTDPLGREFRVPVTERVRVVTERRPAAWRQRVAYRNFDGCPPGLARKYNGCIPPGLAAARTDAAWDRPTWYYNDFDRSYRYRYADGYMLRMTPANRVVSYVPLLGGALAIGQAWPTAYQPVALPDYYSSYYDLGPANSYRAYGDTIYRVNGDSAAITAIAALLTGNDITIGQPMPVGYEVYNVPYAWRSQYRDTPDAMYRYSDGYIYQLDPTTRLVQAAIELLA